MMRVGDIENLAVITLAATKRNIYTPAVVVRGKNTSHTLTPGARKERSAEDLSL
jgi:hypothetical protein